MGHASETAISKRRSAIINRRGKATSICQALREPRIAHAKSFGFLAGAVAAAIRTGGDCRQMDLAGISRRQPPRRRKHPLAFGLSLESTPLRLATPLRSVCALRRAPQRPADQIRQLFCRRRETRLKGKIAMNTTAIFPIFETLVKPFKFAASPCEYKVTALRECPTPDTLQHCETPDKAADYWRLHIASHPHFNPDCECLAVLLLNTRRKVKGHQIVSIGTMDTILVHPREVFRLAIITTASAVIV